MRWLIRQTSVAPIMDQPGRASDTDLHSVLDDQKLRFLLDGLERNSFELPYTLRLVEETRPLEPIRAVASRATLVRLGIELAQAAIDAREEVVLDSSLRPQTDAIQPGLVRVLLMGDKPASRGPSKGGLGCFLLILMTVGVLILAAIGLLTVTGWVR